MMSSGNQKESERKVILRGIALGLCEEAVEQRIRRLRAKAPTGLTRLEEESIETRKRLGEDS